MAWLPKVELWLFFFFSLMPDVKVFWVVWVFWFFWGRCISISGHSQCYRPVKLNLLHPLAVVTVNLVLDHRGGPEEQQEGHGAPLCLEKCESAGKAIRWCSLLTNSYSLIRLICKTKTSVDYNYPVYLMLPVVLTLCPFFFSSLFTNLSLSQDSPVSIETDSAVFCSPFLSVSFNKCSEM